MFADRISIIDNPKQYTSNFSDWSSSLKHSQAETSEYSRGVYDEVYTIVVRWDGSDAKIPDLDISIVGVYID